MVTLMDACQLLYSHMDDLIKTFSMPSLFTKMAVVLANVTFVTSSHHYGNFTVWERAVYCKRNETKVKEKLFMVTSRSTIMDFQNAWKSQSFWHTPKHIKEVVVKETNLSHFVRTVELMKWFCWHSQGNAVKCIPRGHARKLTSIVLFCAVWMCAHTWCVYLWNLTSNAFNQRLVAAYTSQVLPVKPAFPCTDCVSLVRKFLCC